MKSWPQTSALDALLTDPLVRLTMRADRVEPQALKSLLANVTGKLAVRRALLPPANPAAPLRAAGPGAAARRAAPPIDGDTFCGLAPCW